jgi:hypothetical protein
MVEIDCKWEWKERSGMFLLRIRFIPARPSPNFRWKIREKSGTLSTTTIGMKFSDGRSWEVPIVDWAPSWLEFGQIGELMRFTDYLNSLKPERKLHFRELIGEDWINSRDAQGKNWWESILKEVMDR